MQLGVNISEKLPKQKEHESNIPMLAQNECVLLNLYIQTPANISDFNKDIRDKIYHS